MIVVKVIFALWIVAMLAVIGVTLYDVNHATHGSYVTVPR